MEIILQIIQKDGEWIMVYSYYREITYDDVSVIRVYSKKNQKYYYFIGIEKYGIKCKLSRWFETRKEAITAMNKKQYKKYVHVIDAPGLMLKCDAVTQIPDDYKGEIWKENKCIRRNLNNERN